MITQNKLKSILSYNPEIGTFKWNKSGSGRKLSLEAGSLDSDGYWQINIGKKVYKAHRLAWLYVNGDWPVNQIDHINEIKSDNRMSNLRLATNMENMRNRGKQKNNTSGYKGVWFCERGKRNWHAKIQHHGKSIHLGSFYTAIEASKAYEKKAVDLHGEFAKT